MKNQKECAILAHFFQNKLKICVDLIKLQVGCSIYRCIYGVLINHINHVLGFVFFILFLINVNHWLSKGMEHEKY